MTERDGLVLVDAHVHLYDCFDLGALLNAAHRHFERAAQLRGCDNFLGVLMLASTPWEHGYERLLAAADSGEDVASWRMRQAPRGAVVAERGGARLAVIPGRQLVSSERIEVLALAAEMPIDDGQPVRTLLQATEDAGAIPVLPWGVGKWFGRRGRVVEDALLDPPTRILFVGDIAGRPRGWPLPRLLRLARRIGVPLLPGTDPLPLAGEAIRAGSYGFVAHAAAQWDSPHELVHRLILGNAQALLPYGRRDDPLRFLRNQTRIRL